MNSEYWAFLSDVLSRNRFIHKENSVNSSAERWYEYLNVDQDEVKTVLKLSYKQNLRVIAVQIGWRHEESHKFCLDMLKMDWPEGYNWLLDVGVISAPCLNLFNLSSYMGWILGGIPVFDNIEKLKEEERFSNLLEREHWQITNSNILFSRYVADVKPFTWNACNSAIRVAEVAALSRLIGSPKDFDDCVLRYQPLIEADMYSLGSYNRWISGLKAKVNDSR